MARCSTASHCSSRPSHGSSLPPPFFLLGTKSGYLLKVELRRRELLGGVVSKLTPEVRILARFQEHAILYTGMSEAELDNEVSTEQKEELARKKEEERRRKVVHLHLATARPHPLPHPMFCHR